MKTKLTTLIAAACAFSAVAEDEQPCITLGSQQAAKRMHEHCNKHYFKSKWFAVKKWARSTLAG